MRLAILTVLALPLLHVLCKKVQLVYPMSGGAAETASSACGWPR